MRVRVANVFGDQFPSRYLDRPAGPPNPFESYLLLVCIVQGFAVVSGFARPPSIEQLLPNWLRFAWGAMLLFGGLVAFVGLYWPWDAVDSILIKRVGLVAAAGGAAAYGVALLTLDGGGIVAATSNIGFAAACLVRAWQVTVALNRFSAQLRALREVRQIPPIEGAP